MYVKPSMGSSQKYMIKLYAIYHLLKRIGKCKHPIINPVNMKIKDYHIFGQSYKTLYGICCLYLQSQFDNYKLYNIIIYIYLFIYYRTQTLVD